jgi:hypothetical protein
VNSCDGSGSGACKLKDGQPCNAIGDCVSNKCSGMPKICQP